MTSSLSRITSYPARFFFQGTATLSRKNYPESAANYDIRISLHSGGIQHSIVTLVVIYTNLPGDPVPIFTSTIFPIFFYKRSVEQFVASSFSRAP